MNYKFVLPIILSGLFIFCTSIKSKQSEESKNYVPNEETAMKIAEAILVPIYGDEILKKKPFRVKLINGEIWHIEGSINSDEVGGVPIVELQKSDCKILKVIHTK